MNSARNLTPLQRANALMEAAGRMAKRAENYAETARLAPTGQWSGWAQRSIRAGMASLRLMDASRREVRRIVAERAPC